MSEQQPKSGRGCLFYGLIVLGAGLLLMLSVVLFGVWKVKQVVNQYTDSKPMALPVAQLSGPEIDRVEGRVSSFSRALSAEKPSPALVLSGEEINALLATNPQLAPFKDKVYVAIEGDHLEGQVSVPLKDVGWSMLKERYLNGKATFSVVLQNGLLQLKVVNITVKGQPLPEAAMKQLRQKNLAEQANSDSRYTITFERLKKIEIKDGKLIIEPKNLEP